MLLLLEFGEEYIITAIESLGNGQMRAKLQDGNYITFSRQNVTSISVMAGI